MKLFTTIALLSLASALPTSDSAMTKRYVGDGIDALIEVGVDGVEALIAYDKKHHKKGKVVKSDVNHPTRNPKVSG